MVSQKIWDSRPQGYQTFFMCNSTEHKRQIKKFLALCLSDVVFIMLIKCLNAINYWHFNIYEQDKFCAQLS